jgi:ribosome maturation factor RimP
VPDMNQLERIRAVVERVAESEGLEVVEVELHGSGRGTVVRIFLDKPVPAVALVDVAPQGVSLDDCQRVSQQVGMILDVEEIMLTSYTLEVSSPGLDRKLVKPGDYKRFAGNRVAMELKPEAVISGSRKFAGRLIDPHDENISVLLDNGQTLTLEFSDVARANLVPEFPKKEKPGKGPRKPR